MDVLWKSEVDKRLTDLEVKQAIHDTKIATIENDMKTIKDNTTWILRIVILAVLGAILKLVITGGV